LGFQKVPEIKSMKNSFYKGDILYGKLRPYLNKVCVAPFDGVCSTDIIALQSHEDVDTEFLLYLLNSYNIVEQLSHLSYGMRMPRVSEKHFEQITVKVPSFSDQKKVVEKLKTIDNIYSDIEKINKNILIDVQNLPHSVLKKAFNGELIS
jgi:type I restriction enzyme S subunit